MANREEVLKLMDKKLLIENELDMNFEILKMNNIDIHESLVDSEGYPRTDIDVYRVRHARHKIACLRNDHRDIMSQIEQGIHLIHAAAKTSQEDPNGTLSEPPISNLTPFLKIDRVDEGSPSFIDGLKVDDLVCKFGHVSSKNFKALSDIGSVVQRSINKSVDVVVKRDSENMKIVITPRGWSGKGYLGCNVIPIDSPDR